MSKYWRSAIQPIPCFSWPRWSQLTVSLPWDIKGCQQNDQKKLRGWCKYEVLWRSMCHNLGTCFIEIFMLSFHIFYWIFTANALILQIPLCWRSDPSLEWTFFNRYMDLGQHFVDIWMHMFNHLVCGNTKGLTTDQGIIKIIRKMFCYLYVLGRIIWYLLPWIKRNLNYWEHFNGMRHSRLYSYHCTRGTVQRDMLSNGK